MVSRIIDGVPKSGVRVPYLQRLVYFRFVIFLILSLNVFIWFRHGYPIGFGDTGVVGYFLHPNYLFDLYKYAWSANTLNGHPALQHQVLLPTISFFIALKAVGLSAATREALFFGIIELVAMITTYLFVARLLSSHEQGSLVAMLAAVFYVFSPLVMMNFWYTGDYSIATIMALPIILLVIDIMFESSLIIGAIVGSVGLLTCSLAFSNPAFMLPPLGIGVVLVVFRVVQLIRRDSFWIAFRRVTVSLLGGVIALAANGWWLVPLLGSVSSYYQSAVNQEPLPHSLTGIHIGTVLSSLLRMSIYPPSYGFWAYKNPTWRLFYYGWLGFLLSACLMAFVILAMIRRPWRESTGLFVFIAAVGLLFSLGNNSPFGSVFDWLLTRVPMFQAFRSPTSKFVILYAFGIAVLVALGVVEVAVVVKSPILRWLKLPVILFSVCGFAGIFAYPMWTGSVVNGPILIRGRPISSSVSVPRSYVEVADYLNTVGGSFQVLGLPLSQEGAITLDWRHGYDGPDAMWLLLRHPTISFLANIGMKVTSSSILDVAGSRYSIVKLAEVAGSLGCRFVVVRNDVRISPTAIPVTPSIRPSIIDRTLLAAGFSRVLNTSMLTLFAIPPNFVVPMAYTTSEVHPLPPLKKFVALLSASRSSQELPPPIYLPARAIENESTVDADVSPVLTNGSHLSSQVVRVNPVRWIVNVTNAPANFYLVLNQSFSSGWQATLEWQADTASRLIAHEVRLGSSDHVEANEFANAWYIKSPLSANMSHIRIVLSYAPQNFVSIGYELSVAAIVLILLGGTIGWRFRTRWSSLKIARDSASL